MSHFYHLSRIKNKNKNEIILIDMLAYISAVVSPFMTLPQLYGIWIQKNAAGVSFLSWVGFAFFNVIFVIYGITKKEKLIIVNNSIWFVMQSLVAIGVLLYR
jgi:uncharacterized protein with PQ loop repeat